MHRIRIARLLAAALACLGSAARADEAGPTEANEPGPAQASGLRAGVLLNGGLPQPLGVEVFVRFGGLFGVGAGYASLPESIGDAVLALGNVKDAHLSSEALDLDLRWFPFRGSFFLGGALGRQTLTATTTQNGQPMQGGVTTWFATPRLGWLFLFGPGVSLGIDLGAQLPLSSSSAFSPPSAGQNSTAKSAADLIGSTPFPSVHLRLGYLL